MSIEQFIGVISDNYDADIEENGNENEEEV